MWKSTRYFLTALLATLMVVDGAAAGRLFRRKRCLRKCHCACIRKCPTTCCPVSRPLANDGCGIPTDGKSIVDYDGGPVVQHGELPTYCDDAAAIVELPIVEPPITEEILLAPATTIEYPTPTPSVDDMFDEDRAVVPDPHAEPQPSPIAPAPLALPTQPAVVDAPGQVMPSVTPTTPKIDEQQDDLFAPTPPTTDVADDSSDQIFDPEDAAEPEEMEDLFDEPTSDEVERATDPRPEEETPPIEETPSQDSESEFDEFFGVPRDDQATDEPLEQALRSDKPEEPEPEQPEPEQPETEQPETEEPETEEPETEEPETDEPPTLEDLFGQQGAPLELQETGGLQSTATRTWTDDTAQFRCEARLSGVTSTAVTLLKADGRSATVPLARLSTADLQFVQRQVVAVRDVLVKRRGVEQLASAQAH